MLLFIDLDAQRLQKFKVLVVDLEFRIRGQSGHQRSLVRRFFSLLAHPDGGFEDQEDIVSTFFDAGDNLRDLLGVGERFVDGVAEFLHELLELWIHWAPRLKVNLSRSCGQARIARTSRYSPSTAVVPSLAVLCSTHNDSSCVARVACPAVSNLENAVFVGPK